MSIVDHGHYRQQSPSVRAVTPDGYTDTPYTIVFSSPFSAVSGTAYSVFMSTTVSINPSLGVKYSGSAALSGTQANVAPTADAGPAQTVASGAGVTLDGSGSSDPDAGDTLTYAWTQTSGPSVTLSSTTAVSPTFTAPTGPATLVFSPVVTDDKGNVSTASTVTITVNAPGNAAPTANAGPAQTVASGAGVTLDGSGSSDPDAGDTLTYVWTQTSGPSVTLNSTTAIGPTFTAPTGPATLVFSLVVTDDKGNVSTASTVTITVSAPANAAPTANAGPAQTVTSGAGVTLDGSGSSDPDAGDTLTYAWTQTSGPSVTLSSTTAVSPTFTAPAGPATLVFSLVVTDDKGNVSTASTVTITVNAPPSSVLPPLVQTTFQGVTSAFVSRRAERLLSSEPLAYRFDKRKSAGGLPHISLRATDQSARLSFSGGTLSSDKSIYVWSEGELSLYKDATGNLGERDGEFAVIYVGADYLIADNVALGFMAQVDHMSETISGFSDVSGTGWMVGPYLTSELSPDLFFSIRGAWGKSDNTAKIDVYGTGIPYSGDFTTERSLVVATLQGTFSRGEVNISPVAELGYFRDAQSDYRVSDGVSAGWVPGHTTELGRLSLGATIDWDTHLSTDLSVAFIRPELNWNFFKDGFNTDLETTSASVEFGLRTRPDAGWLGEVSIRLDGIGSRDFDGVALRAILSKEF